MRERYDYLADKPPSEVQIAEHNIIQELRRQYGQFYSLEPRILSIAEEIKRSNSDFIEKFEEEFESKLNLIERNILLKVGNEAVALHNHNYTYSNYIKLTTINCTVVLIILILCLRYF